MTAGPLVSVVIPTCRRPALLAEALASVREQTYRHFEAIVVNDAPEDAATITAIVESLRDARFRAVQQPRQGGGAAARNAGLALAKGDVIAFLDDDDLYLPENIERHVAAHFKTTPPAGVVFSGVVRRWLGVRRPDVACPESEAPPDLEKRMLSGGFCPTTTSCVTVLAAALRRSGNFDPELGSFDDWDLWLRLSRSERFCSLREPLIVFRQHAAPRLSHGYAKRVKHMHRAIAKWSEAIDAKSFAAAYAFSAAYDEASAQLSRGRGAVDLAAALGRMLRHARRAGHLLAIAQFLAKFVLGPKLYGALIELRSGLVP